MEAGEILPEPLLLAMFRDRLAQPDAAAGFVLDGFPNQAVQAGMLDAVLSVLAAPVDRVVDLVLTDDEVVRRLSGRRVCRDCGKVWHLEFAPPGRPDVCDTCGGALFGIEFSPPASSSSRPHPAAARCPSRLHP